MTNPKTFSEFIRNATDEEKEDVYLEVIDAATQRQRDVLKLAKDKEKIYVYEDLLHALHFARSVTMSHERVMELLDAIGNWSYAHRIGNGELSDEEQQELIDKAFNKMKDLV